MPTKPQIKTLTNSSVDVLNAIRNNASINYRDYVPYATADANSIREIGAIIMDYPALQNEFLSALVNRIGRVVLTSKMYDNPLAIFKQGMLEFGETIEEIFVNIAKPHQFDPSVAEQKVFAREIPDVKAAFHVMNYQKFYKATISNDQLRQAFLSWDGITDLIAKIVDAMYTGANYDEFQTMKYMVAKSILNGQMYPEQTSTTEAADAVISFRAMSSGLEFLSGNYNMAGVYTHTLRDDQYLLIDSKFNATMDVNVLAAAFNMDRAEFLGHIILVDGFGNLDTARLSELFANDPNYEEIDSGDLELLAAVPAVLVDKNWFMVFDNFQNFTEQYNGEGLYWNYWYHAWKTFSVSPFANAIVFTTTAPGVTSVTVSPDALTLKAGQSGQLSATVVTTGFADKAVTWSVTSTTGGTDGDVTVSPAGLVTVKAGTSATAAVITATAVADTSKTDTCNITITA